ncbi:POT family proton-dependent oligopeptide transporter [Lewinella aquimaris]|uniref:POT family proton-dependent oligopeptide transporter n=1 Tax=Neolewinella aquimaris TaxID=1835722 RepID=A0A840E8L6_9BACT|nr:peptide MFS transporter [Neolewinella aquimaris]MBB4080052.1 POT family proton-dependent oligopeptide transporter [Neolewinella aquimaris]
MNTTTVRHPEDGGSIFGHRPGLFVLFFTEMWERFSYYGMRVLLVVFLVDVAFGDTPWERADALALYGIYTGLVYFTPMIGGILADRLLGYRRAVVLGALIMTAGHAAMAFETSGLFYTGLGLLIVGNGLFKPNISSIVGQLYADDTERKDGAYTIFYMGINAGAFLGILLCSYYGESEAYGYGYGFGLAGIFMFIGLIQFWFAQDIFGDIGLSPRQARELEDSKTSRTETVAVEPEGFTVDASLEPLSTGEDMTPSVGGEGDGKRAVTWGMIGLAIAAVFYYLISTFTDPQANLLQTVSREFMPPIILGSVVGFVGWIVSDKSLKKVERDRVWSIIVFSFFIIFFWWAFEQAGGSMTIFALDYTERSLTGEGAMWFRLANTGITVIPVMVLTWVLFKLFSITFKNYSVSNMVLGLAFIIIWLLIGNMLYEQFTEEAPEVPAGWFQIFNSLFIICFAPAFAKLWEKKISFLRRGPVKFALGLTLLGLGFAILAIGSLSIPDGAKTASVSMFWLIAAYLFHTLGELCISPVGLSYVSKLAPVRLVGLMFGVFFVANFIANFAAGLTGSYIDPIAEEIGLSGFFAIFAAVPITAAIIFVAISGWMKKMMHGIE